MEETNSINTEETQPITSGNINPVLCTDSEQSSSLDSSLQKNIHTSLNENEDSSDILLNSSEDVREASSSVDKNALFDQFYSEVKLIEKRDSTLTSKQQIDRLNRPGATYFNLNPFDVLMVEPDTSIDLLKQKYRRMSILVHPDKNQDDAERAQKAFEAVNKAWKTLQDDSGYKQAQEVVQEATSRVEEMISKKRKELRKEGKENVVAEDDPEKYKHAIYVQTCKLFADLERLRKETEMKASHDRKRKAEEEVKEKEDTKRKKEWAKNFEESREGRVNSWRGWKSGAGKMRGFKPPKVKLEKRN